MPLRERARCATRLGDVHRLMPVLNGQMPFHRQRGEPQAAHEIAGEMLALAEQLTRDEDARVSAHPSMARIYRERVANRRAALAHEGWQAEATEIMRNADR